MAKDKLVTRKLRVLVVLTAHPEMRPREMFVRNVDNLPEGWMVAPHEGDTYDAYRTTYKGGKARERIWNS